MHIEKQIKIKANYFSNLVIEFEGKNYVRLVLNLAYISTNLAYKLNLIGGFKKNLLFSKNNESKQIVVLGRRCSNQNQARQLIGNIIWFTYRKNVKIAEDINSDVGWGCLPRVGQMVLAQSLVTYFSTKQTKFGKQKKAEIIKPFIDKADEQSKYSLSTILKYARWEYSLNPGDWFHIGQLSHVIQKIHQLNPMPGSQKLKIAVFDQSIIYLDQLFLKAGLKDHQLQQILSKKLTQRPKQKQKIEWKHDFENEQKNNECNYNKKLKRADSTSFSNISSDNGSTDSLKLQPEINTTINKNQLEQQQDSNQLKTNEQFENHILLIVSARLGQKQIHEQYYDQLLQLLSLSCSLGLIGGVPSKALYIVGYSKRQVLYMDPHYVQQYVNLEDNVNGFQTYFCKQNRKLSISKLDPSVAFCFYIKNIDDVQQLIFKIHQLDKSSIEEQKSKISGCCLSFMQSKPSLSFCCQPSTQANNIHKSLQFTDFDEMIKKRQSKSSQEDQAKTIR